MLTLAFYLLCLAALVGLGLAFGHLSGRAAERPHPAIAAVHGALGAASLAFVLAALARGLPQNGMGTAGFGRLSAVLLMPVLLLGLGFGWRSWHGRRLPGALLGAHAGLAIAALLVLLAVLVLG
jgi:hypothetical protein